MRLVLAILILLFLGNLLGKIILIQTIPRFKIIKKHTLTVIKLYYGFYIYMLFNKDKDWSFKIKYLFSKNKIIMFAYCFCHCLEKYIQTHPQKEAVCRRNIKYMSTPIMRKNLYEDTKHKLAYA